MSEQIHGYLTTFLSLFEDDSALPEGAALDAVEIPLIQRDYAQGRRNERVDVIRDNFLRAIRGALTEAPISLDFVWGDIVGGTLRPLDGQQRLTTLFLVHWFIAQRAGSLEADAPWRSFTYATRPSARRFCELLVDARPPADVERLSQWITDQPWYQYGWEHDPTIQSMLTMVDSVQHHLGDLDATAAWARLRDRQKPAISFYVLPISEMGAGDDLYITMNSRGKPLTDFENFKAALQGILTHSERLGDIVRKLDGAWADLLWPYSGDDDLIDDEFMRYFEFILEVCEWRRGLVPSGTVEDRAETVFGKAAPHATEDITFLEQAFDCWRDVDIAAHFGARFREPDRHTQADERAMLFNPERLQGVNLLDLCLRHYGSISGEKTRVFPVNLTLVLFGALIERMHPQEDGIWRLRVLRNVVESSTNEIRLDRMGELLDAVEKWILDGDLTSLRGFNGPAVASEQAKREFLGQYPELARDLHLLEDLPVLRGNTEVITLDASTLRGHIATFLELFAISDEWPGLTGALIAAGDYHRQKAEDRYQFGSPSSETVWRGLLTDPARTPVSATRPAWAALLTFLSGRESTIAAALEDFTTQWCTERASRSHFDWRYYLARYPETRRGESGIFVSEGSAMGYELCALRRTWMNSWYRDPILTAMVVRSGLDDLEEPWFMGRAANPRWFEVPSAGARLRNRAEGFLVELTPDTSSETRSRIEGHDLAVTLGEDVFALRIPQGHDGVDQVDRVTVGAKLLRQLRGESDSLPAMDVAEKPYSWEWTDDDLIRLARSDAPAAQGMKSLLDLLVDRYPDKATKKEWAESRGQTVMQAHGSLASFTRFAVQEYGGRDSWPLEFPADGGFSLTGRVARAWRSARGRAN